jgi:hypothetical protein
MEFKGNRENYAINILNYGAPHKELLKLLHVEFCGWMRAGYHS